MTPEQLARRFHELYETMAPEFGYETRKESAVAWEDVPEKNRNLMVAVAAKVLDELQHPEYPDFLNPEPLTDFQEQARQGQIRRRDSLIEGASSSLISMTLLKRLMLVLSMGLVLMSCGIRWIGSAPQGGNRS